MMNLIQEKQESKKKIMIASLVALVGVISALSLLPVSGLAELSTPVRIMLIAVAMADIILCIGISCYLDRDAGTFECRHCKARFVPNMKDYVMAPHTITTRYLKCPACGKSSYCKKRLTR